jgi:hypothetical protein
MNYKLIAIGVLRLEDMANIPADPLNRDWQTYLQWLAAGNTPLPADTPVVAPATPIQTAMATDPAYSALVKAMAVHFNLTVDQIVAMITAQVGA